MIVRRSVASVALALVVAASPALAAPDPMVEITAAGYRVTSAMGARAARDYLVQLERFGRLLELTLGVKRAPSSVPTRILISGSQTWQKTLQPREGIVGFWAPGRFHPFMVVDGGAQRHEVLRTVFHEYTHDFVQTQLARDVPAWWDEGFADFMGGTSFEGDRVVVSAPWAHLQTMRSGAWLPMELVLTADRNSGEYQSHQLAASFYAQSWLLVYYGRVVDKAFGERLDRMVLAYDQGASTRESVKTILGMDYPGLDDLMRAYLKRFRGRATELALPEAAALAFSPPRSVGAEEALRLIAEISLEADQPKRALPVIDALLAHTNEPPVLALRALAASRSGAPDAEEWFARADSATASPDFETARALGLILLARAEALMQPGEPPPDAAVELARRSLQYFERALAAAPDDLESTWGLGLTSYFVEEDVSATQAHVARALARATTSAELAYVAALLAERRGELDAARGAWRDVVRHARFPQLRNFARDRLMALAMEE